MRDGGYAGRYWKDEVGYAGGGYAGGGYAGRGYAGGGYAGRTTSPKSARPGCRFLDQPPPNPQRMGNKNGKRSASRKRNAYFCI